MSAEKKLLDYSDLFSLNDYKKNGKIIYRRFKDNYGKRSKSRVQVNNIYETKNYILDEINHDG